jgi:hypothetical protein
VFELHRKSTMIVLGMLIASLALYGIDYLIFGKLEDIGLGFLGNLAFLPIYVLFVTLMIERILKEREKETLRQKMNMVIGVFFSEVGTHLLRDGAAFLSERNELLKRVRITSNWTDNDFSDLARYLENVDLRMNSRSCSMVNLKEFLASRRMFLLGLLENPNLLEHDGFTDLLWAVFHLMEELQTRDDLDGLPESDLEHLTGDIRRVYGHLLKQWVFYLMHLRSDYPYLYSLAIRNNPLNPEARIVVA